MAESTNAAWEQVKPRIDAIFQMMRARNIIARQNVGTTPENGFNFCCESLNKKGGLKQSKTSGFCYYSTTDCKAAQSTGILSLSIWGAPNGSREQTTNLCLMVCEMFSQQGFPVEWDGNVDQRPRVTIFGAQKKPGQNLA